MSFTNSDSLGLSLTGMRIGPRDKKSAVAKVGASPSYVKAEESSFQYKPQIMKERSGFSGGFKIPDEFRKSKSKKKGQYNDIEQEEEIQGPGQNQLTKDEILQHLNLGHSESGIGVGKHGTNTKNAISKDLVDGLEKEIEKLKRQKENIQLRKHVATTGQSFVEQSEQEKKREIEGKLKRDLEESGAFVIAASPKKLQVMRHQASQLASIKNLDIEEIEQMRVEGEIRMKQLEELYFSKRENSQVGKIIRERMGFHSSERRSQTSDSPRQEFNRDDQDILPEKKKKSVKIAEGKENDFKGNDFESKPKSALRNSSNQPTKPTFNGASSRSPSRGRTIGGGSRSNSRKAEKEDSPIFNSPRQKLYEAKFEKYLANKEQKLKQEKKLSKLQKDDFERYVQGPESPSKKTRLFSASKNGGKYEPESLIPSNYDEQLIQKKHEEDQMRGTSTYANSKDPFKRLGVSNEDKMTFFLLKWIFNAIKRDSLPDDHKLLGKPYITKIDLVKQLSKNDELMNALGYESPEQVSKGVKNTPTAKEGCLMWEEFLDFFFLRQANLERRLNQDHWWRKICHSEPKEVKAEDHAATKDSPQKRNVPRYGTNAQSSAHPYNYEDPDKKPVKMTESLKLLQKTRQGKIEQEVEDEFKAIHQQKIAQKSLAAQSLPAGAKKKVGWEASAVDEEDEETLQEQLGFKREKSECKLLQSQIAIMQEIFENLDKYNDGILRRSQFIMALRTDERIVEFIDVDAVKVPYSQRILTLDEVFIEIEKDEMFETANLGKQANQINHKEFLTWREFMTYFNDYREIEDRNKKAKEIQKTRQKLQKERKGGKEGEGSEDEADQITTLMEKEKQRRLQELPKLRPADQVDISEKQLQLLRDLFDQLPQVPGKEAVYTIDFFIATRKNPQLRAISTAIARDPEGYSRIPRETFQQVFDRMENELQSKELEWSTIVEYFTKRGRPLTKDEIQRLIEEDRRQREDEEHKRRSEEEAERRRIARLMEDLEDNQDFEPIIGDQSNYAGVKDGKKKLTFENTDDHDHHLNEDEYGQDRDVQDYDDDDDEDNIDRDQDAGYTSDPELGTAKRTYNFKEGGAHSPSSKRLRAQSAKGSRNQGGSANRSYNERDLRHSKLTTADYIDHERSQSKKKGKYGVTVPKPFNFDLREKTRTKTIREKKVDEMVAEKRIQEERIIKHQFHHKPIPPEVLIPRYKTIIEANEMRRLEVKKNSLVLTKQNEKPFSFYERDKSKQQLDPEDYLPQDLRKASFKANPIPRACSVLIFDQMMKQQEQERQERIRKQAELNFSKAKLPERMQMHSEKQKQLPPKRADTSDDYTFKPKINDLVTKEQFKKAQDKFNSKLNKKKAQQQVTRPRSPNFTKTSQKTLEREYLNERDGASQQTGGMMDKMKSALLKKMQSTAADDKAAQNPSSTKSMTLAMQKRREELEEKRKQEEAKAKEDQERTDKANRMKNTVQAALKDRIKDDTEKRQKLMEENKQKARMQEREIKQKIAMSIDRARSRPLLIESISSKKHNENLAKIRATKQFVEILENQGLNPKEHLDDEQKELLAEAEFIERRKKELGK